MDAVASQKIRQRRQPGVAIEPGFATNQRLAQI
jgi:hypothetical protein